MRRGRIFIYLALVIIVGLAAVFLLPSLLSNRNAPPAEILPSPTPEIVTVEVVVVTQKVTRGSVISPEVLGMVPIQEDLVIPGLYKSVGEVVGLRTRFDLEPGILLTSAMLIDAEEFSTTGSDWALMIPRGMVAISVPVSRLASVSYAPRRGDHVNVIATMLFVDLDAAYQSLLPNQVALVIAPGPLGEPGSSPTALTGYLGSDVGTSSPQGRTEIEPQFGENGAPFYTVPSGPQRPRLVSQTLIQDVMVLQIGNFPLEAEEKLLEETTPVSDTVDVDTGTPPTGDLPQATPTPVVLPPPPDVITLVVSPQDAVTLNYLIYSGAQLTLALRPADDDTRVQTESVTLQFLLDQYGIPVPVKLPFGMEPPLTGLEPISLPNDIATPTPQP